MAIYPNKQQLEANGRYGDFAPHPEKHDRCYRLERNAFNGKPKPRIVTNRSWPGVWAQYRKELFAMQYEQVQQ